MRKFYILFILLVLSCGNGDDNHNQENHESNLEVLTYVATSRPSSRNIIQFGTIVLGALLIKKIWDCSSSGRAGA